MNTAFRLKTEALIFKGFVVYYIGTDFICFKGKLSLNIGVGDVCLNSGIILEIFTGITEVAPGVKNLIGTGIGVNQNFAPSTVYGFEVEFTIFNLGFAPIAANTAFMALRLPLMVSPPARV